MVALYRGGMHSFPFAFSSTDDVDVDVMVEVDVGDETDKRLRSTGDICSA